jgi:Acyclic terpene utilisation family protein AtuA
VTNTFTGASGSASDRRHAISILAANYPTDPVDVIIGDVRSNTHLSSHSPNNSQQWMSEANMASLASKKSLSSSSNDIFYEPTFLEALSSALPSIHKHGIKVAVNAGASDTKGLSNAVKKMIREQGLEGKVKVAWVEGDDVLDIVKERLNGRNRWKGIREKKTQGGKGISVFDTWMEGGEVGEEVREYIDISRFENLCTGQTLREWEFKDDIIAAQAYLGGLGIAKAFEEGADIVICGRVSDASPVIGAAFWWHGWRRGDLRELANAFVAGHLIECSNYVCGGNFTGFKDFEGEKWLDIGYPIAEIGKEGDVVITKQKRTGGLVTVETCKAQLLYEIQGPYYFNVRMIKFPLLFLTLLLKHSFQVILPKQTKVASLTPFAFKLS